ncbi:hypothetical protein M513_01335 [Trichuris suis]|uniref:Uncharacterized protein n=1 Tax=Trichuris suis TaxID=68888 RepID=A0A085MKB9_9BILA|nr:hypothetical protein M513_01335 [Trichuris suis]
MQVIFSSKRLDKKKEKSRRSGWPQVSLRRQCEDREKKYVKGKRYWKTEDRSYSNTIGFPDEAYEEDSQGGGDSGSL